MTEPDIVERLRAQRWSQDTDANREQTALERAAADEIELLRQHVVEMAAEADRLAALVRQIACQTDPEHGRKLARRELELEVK
jgi:hypothetical protein